MVSEIHLNIYKSQMKLRSTTINSTIMNMRIKLLLVIAGLCMLSAGIAQESATRVINGTVKDAKGGPLQSITVTEKGTTNAVITNATGAFTIKVKVGTATLVITGVGFHPQEIKVVNEKPLSIEMVDDSKELTDVVVVGFGT